MPTKYSLQCLVWLTDIWIHSILKAEVQTYLETSFLLRFSPLQTEKSLRLVYMGFVVDEVAVVQYKLQFFITVMQLPVVTWKRLSLTQ
jgi:hypothetical protein